VAFLYTGNCRSHSLIPRQNNNNNKTKNGRTCSGYQVFLPNCFCCFVFLFLSTWERGYRSCISIILQVQQLFSLILPTCLLLSNYLSVENSHCKRVLARVAASIPNNKHTNRLSKHFTTIGLQFQAQFTNHYVFVYLDLVFELFFQQAMCRDEDISTNC